MGELSPNRTGFCIGKASRDSDTHKGRPGELPPPHQGERPRMEPTLPDLELGGLPASELGETKCILSLESVSSVPAAQVD